MMAGDDFVARLLAAMAAQHERFDCVGGVVSVVLRPGTGQGSGVDGFSCLANGQDGLYFFHRSFLWLCPRLVTGGVFVLGQVPAATGDGESFLKCFAASA